MEDPSKRDLPDTGHCIPENKSRTNSNLSGSDRAINLEWYACPSRKYMTERPI